MVHILYSYVEWTDQWTDLGTITYFMTISPIYSKKDSTFEFSGVELIIQDIFYIQINDSGFDRNHDLPVKRVVKGQNQLQIRIHRYQISFKIYI